MRSYGLAVDSGPSETRIQLYRLDQRIKDAIKRKDFRTAELLQRQRDALFRATQGRTLRPVTQGRTLYPAEKPGAQLPWWAIFSPLYGVTYALLNKRSSTTQRPRYDVPGWDARQTDSRSAYRPVQPVPMVAPAAVTAPAVAQTPALAPVAPSDEAAEIADEGVESAEGVLGYWNHLSTTTKVAVGVGALGAAYFLFLRR
jgi:hypothetical protein